MGARPALVSAGDIAWHSTKSTAAMVPLWMDDFARRWAMSAMPATPCQNQGPMLGFASGGCSVPPTCELRCRRHGASFPSTQLVPWPIRAGAMPLVSRVRGKV